MADEAFYSPHCQTTSRDVAPAANLPNPAPSDNHQCRSFACGGELEAESCVPAPYRKGMRVEHGYHGVNTERPVRHDAAIRYTASMRARPAPSPSGTALVGENSNSTRAPGSLFSRSNWLVYAERTGVRGSLFSPRRRTMPVSGSISTPSTRVGIPKSKVIESLLRFGCNSVATF